MMKVLHIITSLESGGAQSFLRRIILSDNENFHYILCFRNEKKIFEEFKNIAVNVKCIGILDLFGIYRFIKESSPDVLQTWLYHSDLIGGLYGLFMGIPICWNIRNSNLFKSGDISITAFLSIVACILLSRINKNLTIVANSRSGINFHKKIGYCEKKFKLIENGIELSEGRLNNLSDLNKRDLEFVVLARYSPSKGFDYLFQSLSDVAKYKFTVKCYGKNVNDSNVELKALIDKYGISSKVLLCGEYDDVKDAFSGVHYLIQASITEGFPNVLIESMNFGVPCIVSDVGDSKLIIKNSGLTYIRCQNGLSSAILDAAHIFTNEKSEYIRMSDRSLEIIRENYDITKIVKQYKNLWKEVAETAA